ncbi:MAG: serpin family protein [Actinomycetia bacterium]|nr:serpin family protein [Actinomycetes bacterium]
MSIKKIIIIISAVVIIFAVLLFSVNCCSGITYLFRKTPKETEANKETDKIAESVDETLVNLNTDFALKIFKALSNEDKNLNVFISPISVSLAIAMAYNGSKNQTQQEIAEALEFKDYNIDELNSSFKVLLSSMANIDEMVELYTGNSIWSREDYTIEKDFTELVEYYYDASIYNVDFNDPNTAGKMNNWVSEATKGKISNIVSPKAIEDAVMYLINAIYFKGQWKDKFETENTKEDDFFLTDRNVKKVQMMENNKEYEYYDGSDFQMIRIPYGRNKTAMYVFLPDEDTEIGDFVNSLSCDLLNKSISEASATDVILKFPRFSIEYGTKSLIEPLKSLGMVNAFIADKADFSSIAPLMFISQIDHKAIIEVNEEGTVAAAATSMGMGLTAEKPVEFIVNRPFVLLIRDDRTGNILFMGKILEP